MALYLLLSPLYAAVALPQNLSGRVRDSKKNHSVLHLKFKEEADVAIKRGRFVSAVGQDLSAINDTLKPRPGRTAVSELFASDDKEIDAVRERIRQKRNRVAPDLNSYFRVRLVGSSANSLELSQTIESLPYVEDAYPEPLPAPAPSPSFVSSQTYLRPASELGMGVSNSSIYPGVGGGHVTVADVEYSWNTQHEDVSDARAGGSLINNGTPSDPFNNNNHGTAVTGILNGDRNVYGVDGIVPDAQLRLVNTYSLDRGWDVANAIHLAAQNLSLGDVILVEQQTWGPDGRSLVPVEWVPAVYDAIKFATESGITVIEAAGNSGVNLDSYEYGSTFPMGKPDSGAIIVGAGTACGYAPPRARLYYSNYGSRINLQGHGECVATSGYGTAYWDEGQNAWYTTTFNGTSSAAAMVAGAAAALSSTYERLNGSVLSAFILRSYLVQTGTPQDFNWSAGHIGPLPNLREAVKLADTLAPNQPTNFRAAKPRIGQVKLAWSAASDNVAVKQYQIYRDNVLIKTVTGTRFVDKTVKRRTYYTYKVRTVDVSDLTSAFSSSIKLKTR